MKNSKYFILPVLALLMVSACSKRNDNVVAPNVDGNFPQIINLSDEGDGGLEDEDKFSFKMGLIDRVDPSGENLGGKIIPLEKTVRVNFAVNKFEGFSKLSDYIKDAKAFYEIDDCSTSEDEGIDLKLNFDVNTGKGSVDFPAGVEEIEIEFETNDGLFDDDVLNNNDRKIEIELTGIESAGTPVTVNIANKFEYEVLDDEAIHGEYELDVNNATQFNNFVKLFGLINEDVKGLKAADVDEIVIEFAYNEFKAVIKLKETEMVDECGQMEEVNKEIEIEGGIEELDLKALTGAVEFADDIEQEDGTEQEFKYSGSFTLNGKTLVLKLKGKYNDEETEEITLNLSK